MKDQIVIAAKMYECQDSAKKLFRDEYKEKVQWYIDVIKAVMNKEKLDELKAVLWLSNMDAVKNNGVAIMMFMAAAVEIIEP